jgi:CTP:molybdopterin cytidylyltransferase MocA
MSIDGHEVGVVILAAGEASRFGSAKQQLLLPTVLDRVLESLIRHVVVVAGAYPLDLPDDVRVELVRATDWRLGPGASLRTGLEALRDTVEAAAIVLADGPQLDPAALARVISGWAENKRSVVAADYGSGRSHPVVLAREVWATIPDGGARALEPFLIDCSDLTGPGDVDTEEDLARLRNI